MAANSSFNPPHPLRSHESRDANAKWIFAIVGLLVVLGVVMHFLVAWYLNLLNRRPPATDYWRPNRKAIQESPGRPGWPLLQISPALDWKSYRVHEQGELQSYGWVNRTAGIVRIPIERAMQVMLTEGFPTRDATNRNQAGPSSLELIQQRVEQRTPKISQ